MKLLSLLLGSPFDVRDPALAPVAAEDEDARDSGEDELCALVLLQVASVELGIRTARRDLYLGLAWTIVVPFIFGLLSDLPVAWYAMLFGGHVMLGAALWLQHGRALFPLPTLTDEPLGNVSSWLGAVRHNNRRVRAQADLRVAIRRGLNTSSTWFLVATLDVLLERFGWFDIPDLALISVPAAILILVLVQSGYARLARAALAWGIRHPDDDALPYLTFWADTIDILMETTEWVVTMETTVTADGRAYVTIDTRCARAALLTPVSQSDLSARLAAFCRVMNNRSSDLPFADEMPWRPWGSGSAADFIPVEDEIFFGWTVVYDGVDVTELTGILVTDIEAFATMSLSHDGDEWAFRAVPRGPALSPRPAPITPALLFGGGSVRFLLRLPGQWLEHNAVDASVDGAAGWRLSGHSIEMNARSGVELR